MVIQRAGASQNAYYFQAVLIVSALQSTAAYMTTSFTVEAARDRAHLELYARRTLIHCARLLVPIVLVVFVAAPLILRLYGESYAAEGTALLRLLVLSVIPYIIIIVSIGVARVLRHIARLAALMRREREGRVKFQAA